MQLFHLLIIALMAMLAFAGPLPQINTVDLVTTRAKPTAQYTGNFCGGRWGFTGAGFWLLDFFDYQYVKKEPDTPICVGAGSRTCLNIFGTAWLSCMRETSIQMCNDNDHQVCLPIGQVYARSKLGWDLCAGNTKTASENGWNSANQIFFEDNTNFILNQC